MLYVLLGILIVSPIVYWAYTKYQSKRLREWFMGQYHNWDNRDYDFDSLKYIRKYWDVMKDREAIEYAIDEITWKDLDMDHVFFRMNACRSSVGEECLYARLRCPVHEPDNLNPFIELRGFFEANEVVRVEALCALNALGKYPYNNVHSYIFDIESKPLKNIKKYYLLLSLFLVSAVSCVFTAYGFLFLLLSVSVNIIVYYKDKMNIEMQLNAVSYISRLVHCAEKLSGLDYGKLKYAHELKNSLTPLKNLSTLGNSLYQKGGAELDFLLDYIKIILMWDFLLYNRIMGTLSKHKEEFRHIYQTVGLMDNAIAIQSYKKALPYAAQPEFCPDDGFIFEGVYHPLVEAPVPNTFLWQKDAIITGSNASGKSTFVKALAITILCAQSIGLCFAARYRGRPSHVMSSMAVKDTVYEKESYFVAETRSLKRMLDSLSTGVRSVFFIDEILKGTNTVERIAASAAILRWLADKNCLVMVASHDNELTEILAWLYENFHFSEQVLADEIRFDYQIHPGRATTRNAIQMLRLMSYEGEIIELADRLAEGFERERHWPAMDGPA